MHICYIIHIMNCPFPHSTFEYRRNNFQKGLDKRKNMCYNPEHKL